MVQTRTIPILALWLQIACFSLADDVVIGEVLDPCAGLVFGKMSRAGKAHRAANGQRERAIVRRDQRSVLHGSKCDGIALFRYHLPDDLPRQPREDGMLEHA